MKELTLSFTTDEYCELAKLLSLATYVLPSNGYHNVAMVNEIYNRICEKGFKEIPETGAFMKAGELNNTPFDVSFEVQDELTPVIELFEIACIEDHLPFSLADRDFIEQYGELEPEVVFMNPELLSALKAIQKKYIDEFETYGVTHLRLEERRGFTGLN